MSTAHSPKDASKIGVVLGSGLGAFADTLSCRCEMPYAGIPGWPPSTAIGHPGKLVSGRIGAAEVIVLAGRAHLYEGYTPKQVTFGIHELARRGVRSVILTNAAGGINLAYRPGQLVLLSDHINLLGVNPLTGVNEESLGPRFPDMSDAYSHACREIAKEAARSLGLTLEEGVYAAVPGPVMRPRPKSAICAPSALTWSECRQYPRPLPRIIWACRSWGFPASPTWLPECGERS